MSHDDFAFEPMPGLPAPLPPGERLLWQGSPNWKALAIGAYHARKAAVYFALLITWRVGVGVYHGEAVSTIAVSSALLAALGGVAIGVLCLLAYCSARCAVFTITSRRVLLRHGIAVPLTLNVPFCAIQSAALKRRGDDVGNIALSLNDSARVGYLITWPYLKSANMAKPTPSLRAVPESSVVASILASALAADAGQAVPVSVAVASERQRVPLSGSRVAAA